MDESVLRGMARWPDVPAVFGWLALDRRGRWRLRGEPIGNERTRGFIARNYAVDAHGRWFFQNGPQRVFVALDYAPHVLFTDARGDALTTHAGWPVSTLRGVWIDPEGALLLATEHGAGLIADRDLPVLAERLVDAGGAPADEDALEALLAGVDVALALEWGGARHPVHRLAAGEAPRRFGYDPDPRPLPDE